MVFASVFRVGAALAALAAMAAQGVPAEEAGAPRWSCGYQAEPAPSVACRLARAPGPEAIPAAVPPWMERMPPVVRRIRGDPGSLDGQVILIPLHAPPIDMRQAARLARGVLCGGRAGCEVEFATPP